MQPHCNALKCASHFSLTSEFVDCVRVWCCVHGEMKLVNRLTRALRHCYKLMIKSLTGAMACRFLNLPQKSLRPPEVAGLKLSPRKEP